MNDHNTPRIIKIVLHRQKNIFVDNIQTSFEADQKSRRRIPNVGDSR